MDNKLDEYIELYIPGFRDFTPGKKVSIFLIFMLGFVLLLWLPIRSCSSSSSPSVSGMYRIAISSLTTFDSDRNEWELQLEMGQPAFIYRKNKVTAGLPLLIKTDCVKKPGRVSIILQVIGQAGERYLPGALKNGKRQPPPKFEIVDESGDIFDSGSFEYDQYGICQYSWRVPYGFKGRYQVNVRVNLGPFEAQSEKRWYSI
ncbi:MAG: hypothetical protein ACYTE8_07620 [Planctomycetota bacterium]|jgi:hypothetical protein